MSVEGASAWVGWMTQRLGEKRQHTKWAQAFEVIQRDRRLLWLRAPSSEGLTGRCSVYKYFPSDPCHLVFVPPGSRWGCVTPCSSLVASEGAMYHLSRRTQGLRVEPGCGGSAPGLRPTSGVKEGVTLGLHGLALWFGGLSFLICETDMATLASSGLG